MIELLSQPEVWISLLTLTFLEIVLGIDNIIFLSILVSRLPRETAASRPDPGPRVRDGHAHRPPFLAGLAHRPHGARGSRCWARRSPGRDLILFVGGLFLLVKSVNEIHGALEGAEQVHSNVKLRAKILSVAIQIGLIDIVFSLDSVLTAVGLANHVPVMVTAIVIAVLVMMFLARPIHEFIERHPTIKMLALSFLILIGVALIGESLEFDIPKGYLYFAMAFSIGVEMINIRLRKRTTPVDLRGPELPAEKTPQALSRREHRRGARASPAGLPLVRSAGTLVAHSRVPPARPCARAAGRPTRGRAPMRRCGCTRATSASPGPPSEVTKFRRNERERPRRASARAGCRRRSYGYLLSLLWLRL